MSIILIVWNPQLDEVLDTKCIQCGGIPQADWLPFWVYDMYTECTCWLTEAEEAQGLEV